ncbi:MULTISPECIES: helix-turn-helix domain-containing protein [Acetobacter]|nr:helix-turn-helix domain-containing protein [Acetobacter indonesiensis]
MMPQPPKPPLEITTAPKGSWVQTERAAHEAWARLIASHPKAAALMHVIVGNMGNHNALVASQKTLAKTMGCTVRTVQRAIEVLRDGQWLEVRQVGAAGTTNAYVVNDRVAWSGPRDGIRYSLFSASVLITDEEQPDRAELANQEPLRAIPALYPGERQLPTGPGMPPPSQPSIDGLEPDLPVRQQDPRQSDLEDFTRRPGR